MMIIYFNIFIFGKKKIKCLQSLLKYSKIMFIYEIIWIISIKEFKILYIF